MTQSEDGRSNGSGNPDPEDPVLDVIGNWGPWQRKMFFITGCFLIPGTFHVLVLTFINADQVCDNAHLRSLAQTIFFAGMLGGVWLTGVASDKFGRKRVTIPLLIVMSILGLASAHMATFTTFIIMRSLCAMTFIGVFETLFTWMLEVCGGTWTTYVGMGVEFFWVSAWLILALLAYLIRQWRILLTLISLPGLAGISLIWLMPESPKWLLTVGRVDEATQVVRKIFAYNNKNGQTLPEDWRLKRLPSRNDESTANCFDLVRHRSLLGKTSILIYNWFVNSFCYYGLALNAYAWGGDVHLTFAINGFLEIPAYALSIVILLRYGRRYPYAISMLSTGAILLMIIGLPKGDESWAWAKAIIGTLGKFFVTFSFGVIYLYTAELFPTVLRTTGLGISSFCARFGGMASSWIVLLAAYDPHAPLITFGLSGNRVSFSVLDWPSSRGRLLLERLRQLAMDSQYPRTTFQGIMQDALAAYKQQQQLAFAAGAIAFLLPETHHRKLPDTIEESEKFPLGCPCNNNNTVANQ